MSYVSVISALRTHLLSDTTLAAYNHWVDLKIGENSDNIRNTNMLIEIDVPNGQFIEPQNAIVTGGSSVVDDARVDEQEHDFENYNYLFKLRTLRKGLTDRYEITGLNSKKTIFDFEKDVRNRIDNFFKVAGSAPYSLNLQDCEYSPIEFVEEDGDGHFNIYFTVTIQEEIELENR